MLALLLGAPAFSSPENLKEGVLAALTAARGQTDARLYADVSPVFDALAHASVAYSAAQQIASYHIFEIPGEVYTESVVCRQAPAFSPASINYKPLTEALERGDVACRIASTPSRN